MASSKDYVTAVIIEDDDDDIKSNTYTEPTNDLEIVSKSITRPKKPRKIQMPLKTCLNECPRIIEIGIDEAGRGPLFGRVYAGAVVLPKVQDVLPKVQDGLPKVQDVLPKTQEPFNHSLMKDSKKFSSKKKIEEVATYIQDNAIAWAVEYEDEQTIDEINILQATQSAMHKAIRSVVKQLKDTKTEDILLLVDGNYFKPLQLINSSKTKLETIKFQMIEGGDNKFTPIAAASILAKVHRDRYIDDLCEHNPELNERYGIGSNKGYGAKIHIDGIKQYGITKWHRRTFGICKEF